MIDNTDSAVSYDGWWKIAESSKTTMGHAFIYDDGWNEVPIGESAKQLAERSPDAYKLADCDQCKHQLACVVHPKCNRLFEGKE